MESILYADVKGSRTTCCIQLTLAVSPRLSSPGQLTPGQLAAGQFNTGQLKRGTRELQQALLQKALSLNLLKLEVLKAEVSQSLESQQPIGQAWCKLDTPGYSLHGSRPKVWCICERRPTTAAISSRHAHCKDQLLYWHPGTDPALPALPNAQGWKEKQWAWGSLVASF